MHVFIFTGNYSAVSEYPRNLFDFRVGALNDIYGRRAAGGELDFLPLPAGALITEAVDPLAVFVIPVIASFEIHIMENHKTGCHTDCQSQYGNRRKQDGSS